MARELGLPEGVLVVAGGADNACSAVGNGVLEEGQYLVSIGSSGVVLASTESLYVDPENGLHSFNHSGPDRWYLMGVMLSAGLSLRWFVDAFGNEEKQVADRTGCDTYSLITKEASRVPIGSEKLIFLPYLNGERTPHGNPDARGVFFGLSDHHGKEHFARAVIEGITFGLRDSMELVSALGVPREDVRITGGGSKSEFWSQVIADNFSNPVKKTSVSEGPGYGAALLAGVGAGVFCNVKDAVASCVEAEEIATPRPKAERQYKRIYKIYRSLYQSLKADFSLLVDADL